MDEYGFGIVFSERFFFFCAVTGFIVVSMSRMSGRGEVKGRCGCFGLEELGRVSLG